MFARDIRDWCGRIQVIGSLSLGYFFKVILFNLFLFKARQMSYAMTPLCYLAAKVQRIRQTTKNPQDVSSFDATMGWGVNI